MKRTDMKNLMRTLFFAGLVIAIFSACHKDYGAATTTQPSTPLTLSAARLGLGQTVTASVPSGFSTAAVTWTVRPSTGVDITPGNLTATITFADLGTYHITATAITNTSSGAADSCIGTVTVIDSASNADSISAAGKDFVLVPLSISDTSVNFLLRTVDSFPCHYGILMKQDTHPWGDSISVLQIDGGLSDDLCSTNVPSTAYFYQHSLATGASADIWIFLPWGGGSYQVRMTNTGSGYTFTMVSETGTQLTVSPTAIST